MRLSILLISITVFACFSGTAIQTDWCGGGGVLGPVTDWADEFYSDTDVNWSSASNICLSYPEQTIDEDVNGVSSVYATDVDGDGDMDVVGCSNYDSYVSWWENIDGSGSSWSEHTVAGYFNRVYCICTGDIDNDGYSDILGAANVGDDIAWWKNQDGAGTNWIEYIVDSDFDGARGVCVADVNGDGHTDIIGAALLDNCVTWWENNDGSGISWTEHTVDSYFLGAYSVYARDINGDGYMDVIGAASNADDITWWENDDGSGTSWSEHTIDGDFDYPVSVYSEDVDGDGYYDVLGAAYYGDAISWWKNDDGSGTSWTKHTVDSDFEGARSAYARDIDGDGDMDIMGASADDVLTWWENNDGSGTSWIEHTIVGDYDDARSIFAADIDGDGQIDVLGGSFGDDRIAWWDVGQYIPEGSLESSILNTQDLPLWDCIDWTVTEPAGTNTGFQVRSSNDPGNMGSWSDTLTSPGSLAGHATDQDTLFQYRLIISTSDSSCTPILEDVTVDWMPYTHTEDESAVSDGSFHLYGANPNPAFRTAAISFALPVDVRASLTVYDLSGRAVESYEYNYVAGAHQIYLNDLARGVYIIRMRAGDFDDTRRFVLLK